jgi:hypothetical protein
MQIFCPAVGRMPSNLANVHCSLRTITWSIGGSFPQAGWCYGYPKHFLILEPRKVSATNLRVADTACGFAGKTPPVSGGYGIGRVAFHANGLWHMTMGRRARVRSVSISPWLVKRICGVYRLPAGVVGHAWMR